MRTLLVCVSLLALPAVAIPLEKPLSPQENFFLRRISEFWKDKDYALVKQQILEYLAAHPESSVKDNLYALLGDLYFQEEKFSEALAAYQKIQGEDFQHKALYRHVQALYELGDFRGIITVATPFFTQNSSPRTEHKEEVAFLLAEALYKELLETQNPEERSVMAERAKHLYLSFSSEPYKESALFPLAEIHQLLNEYPQACALYVLMAEKHPDKAEELLFQAATLQLSFDRNGAIDTYGKVAALKGAKSTQSAYNQYVLLFQNDRHADLIKNADQISAHLAPEKLPLFHFCLGRSYFLTDNYAQAASVLETYLKEVGENSEQRKSAFLTMLACAQKLNDQTLFDTSLEALITAYPQDSEAAQALLLHAQTAMKKENLAGAAQDLSRLIESFPEFSERQSVMYDHALLLAQQKEWKQSRASFLALIHQFPASTHADLVWSYILNCSIQELKEASEEFLTEKKTQFVSDLEHCLARPTLFSQEERANYHFLLGKTLFELDRSEEAIAALESHLITYPDHITAGESHLLLALATQDPATFVSHAQHALASNANIADRGVLHMQLFNAYLHLNQLEQAANHLFEASIVYGYPIQAENRLWLANFYFNDHKNDFAALLFQKLLGIENSSMKISIDPRTPFLEAESLKLASILAPEKRVLLLSSLIELQQKHADMGWKFQRRALFDLGKAYEALQQTDRAFEVYDSLISSASHAPSYFSTAALLEKSRLLYSTCSEQERMEGNPKMALILSSLKDLQIQKKLVSEPIHLEAALEYVDIRTSLADPEQRPETALFFLGRVKEDYSCAEYIDGKYQFPEQEKAYQNYMKCVEAEMLRLEALVAKKEQRIDQSVQAETVAITLLQELVANSELTPYLRSRVEINLKALGQ
jgi:tetratricopeptide (TPR) repeat protein